MLSRSKLLIATVLQIQLTSQVLPPSADHDRSIPADFAEMFSDT
jgi:hypothetical protein